VRKSQEEEEGINQIVTDLKEEEEEEEAVQKLFVKL